MVAKDRKKWKAAVIALCPPWDEADYSLFKSYNKVKVPPPKKNGLDHRVKNNGTHGNELSQGIFM